MKNLRLIRIILSLIFLICAVAYLLISPAFRTFTQVAEKTQIILSALSTTMGVTIVWVILTLLLGRVYCSTVCPIGTLQDLVIWLRRKAGGRRHPLRYSYRSAGKMRYQVLIIYIGCLIIGVMAIPYWLSPWNMMRNICCIANPTAVQTTWLTLGMGVTAGMAAGVVSAGLIIACALFTGRGYCTDICPIGTALGLIDNFALYHIEIDPETCVNCMKCEEVCKSQCVKVVGRYVDNSRCVRCFDCMSVCPNNAIRMQINRNRPRNPLLQKSTTHANIP